MGDFETKDSGERQEFDSGMHRDTEAGKARFDLIIPEGVPYADQLLTRFAELMGRGAVKYESRNWEQANSEAEIARAKSSAFRHFMQWFCGEVDEDHAAATMFNLLVVETTRNKLDRAVETPQPEPLREEDGWQDGGFVSEDEIPSWLQAAINKINEDVSILARLSNTGHEFVTIDGVECIRFKLADTAEETPATEAGDPADWIESHDVFGPDLLKKHPTRWDVG